MMKKALLPLAIAAVMPMSAMAVGPIDGKIYGKANVTIVNDDTDSSGSSSADEWSLNSNASRVGIKGKAELSDGFYAIYKAEYEIFIDDGQKASNQTFSQRNIYVGLSGSYGTVFAGKHDTVLKLSQAKVDLFNDLEGGDVKNWMSGETRANNVINYTTPTISGFSASFMTVLGENNDSTKDQDGLLDSYSMGVSFKQDDLYLAIARDENIDSGSGADDFVDITRLVASYSMGDFTVGAIIQTAEDGDNFSGNVDNTTNDSYDEDSYTLSLSYKVGSWKYKFQYGESETEVKASGTKTTDEEVEAMILGVDYKLAKNTKVYGYYSVIETDNNLTNTSVDDTVFGVGMEHKF